jgi:O-methyltransferase
MTVHAAIGRRPWWTGDRRLELIENIRPYTMVRQGALEDLVTQVRAILVNDVPGDFVECGVWRGGAAFLIAECLQEAGVENRKVWLFDSYEGLPLPLEIDGAAAAEYAANVGSPYDNCTASLDEVQRAAVELGLECSLEFVKGWFEETLPTERARVGPIALLRIDCDWYSGVRCCLENLYENVSRNGLVFFDDYYTFDGAAVAVHEFLGSRRLAHRLENVTGDDRGFSVYQGALFTKDGSDWSTARDWLARVDEAAADVAEVIPDGAPFALAERAKYASVDPRFARACPFNESDGEDWGAPRDDEAAVDAVMRLRSEGVHFAVLPWSSSWWLDEYAGLATYLRSRCRLALETKNVTVFDLRR